MCLQWGGSPLTHPSPVPAGCLLLAYLLGFGGRTVEEEHWSADTNVPSIAVTENCCVIFCSGGGGLLSGRDECGEDGDLRNLFSSG